MRLTNPRTSPKSAREPARRRLARRAQEMVRADAPRPRARRQGSQLPQAGSRLELSRAVRGARRDPARPRHDVPARPGLPLPLLPRPHDLRRRRADGRGDPLERHVEGDRRRLGRPAHVEPLRQARDRHPERLLLRLEPRAARRRASRRAIKTYGKDAIVFCSVGESSTSEGYFYEAVNGASREKLPVVFVVQDNGYGISVPKTRPDRQPLRLATTSRGFKNLKIIHCDGLDVFDSFRAMREAVAFVRSGAGLRDRPRDLSCGSTRTPTPTARSSTARPRSSPAAQRRRSAAPLPQARCSRRGLVTEEELARDRGAERADLRGGGRPRQGRRRTRTRPRSSSTSCPSPGSPRTWPEGLPDGSGEEHDARPGDQRDAQGGVPRATPTRTSGARTSPTARRAASSTSRRACSRSSAPTRVFNAPIAEDFIMGTADGFSRLSRRHPRRRRGRRVRRLLLAGRRADGRDVARVLAHQRPVRAQRHRAPRLGRLHRRRPLPLPEHRGLADDAARHPHRRPGLRRRRGGPAAHGDPLARHHAVSRAEVPLQQPDGAGERAGGVRRAVRQGARAPRGNGPDDRSPTARPSTSRSRRRRRSRRKASASRSSTCAPSFRSTSTRSSPRSGRPAASSSPTRTRSTAASAARSPRRSRRPPSPGSTPRSAASARSSRRSGFNRILERAILPSTDKVLAAAKGPGLLIAAAGPCRGV